MVILNPRVSTLKVWIVFCFGNDFLIKSILTDCASQIDLGVSADAKDVKNDPQIGSLS